MTDLTTVTAATTHPSTSLRQAEQMMINQGVRMLFVTSDMPALEGLITTTDLAGDRAMSVVAERHVRHDELRVSDVMTPLSMLDAISLDSLQRASVGNAVATIVVSRWEGALDRDRLRAAMNGAPLPLAASPIERDPD